MSFKLQYNRLAAPALTDAERKQANILLVEPQQSMRQGLRLALTALGFGAVTDAVDHQAALQKLDQRGVTHVIFDARKTSMPVKEFLSKALNLDPNLICIASSFEPTVDDVFDLLIGGAKGYVVKPFNSDSLDEAIIQASKGEPISEAILFAKNRNQALAAFIMTSLDKAALIARQATQFETARIDLPKRILGLRRASEVGRLFALGGESKLVEAIMEFCLERGEGPASRLGRIRQRISGRKRPGVAEASEPISDEAPDAVPAVISEPR
jgi:DNA-binding NarL/FixJ family response regulator